MAAKIIWPFKLGLGSAYSGYKVFIYVTDTATKTDSWTSEDKAVANANPVILDSAGRADIFIEGQVRVVLAPSTDTDPPVSPVLTANDITSYQDINLSGVTGMVASNGSGTYSGRTITGTSGEITVTNGTGVSGNPTLSLPSSLDFSNKTSVRLPVSTTAAPTTAGDLILDSSITDHQDMFKYSDGATEFTIIAVKTSDLTTTDRHLLLYDATNDKFTFSAGPKIIQVGRTNYTTQTTIATVIPTDNSIPQITEGTALVDVVFTPLYSTSTLEIEAVLHAAATAAADINMAVGVIGNVNCLSATSSRVASTAEVTVLKINFTVAASSTSARTYRLIAGTNSGVNTVYLNSQSGAGALFGGVLNSYLKVTELAA